MHVGLAVYVPDTTVTPLSQEPPEPPLRTALYAPTPAPCTVHKPVPAPRATKRTPVPALCTRSCAATRTPPTVPPLKPELQTLMEAVQAPVDEAEQTDLSSCCKRTKMWSPLKINLRSHRPGPAHINTGNAPIKQWVTPIHQKDQALQKLIACWKRCHHPVAVLGLPRCTGTRRMVQFGTVWITASLTQ